MPFNSSGGRRDGLRLDAEPDAECSPLLYRDVLEEPLPWIDDIVRAQRLVRLPVVLTIDEIKAVIGRLPRLPRIAAMLLYGAGLRLLEALTFE